MTIERILIAVDGSENSLAAVRWGAELAAAVGAEVVVVHAVGLLERLEDDPAGPEHQTEAVAQRLRTTWCAPLAERGVPFRAELRDGAPVPVVLAAADAEDADVVVLGSRGLGGFPEQLLGSTSTQVAQHSSRPVVVVPCP